MHHCIPFLRLDTSPASEPLTAAEAKLYLRVDGSTEDSAITRMIATARQAAESYMRRSLITQTWTIAYDEGAPAEVKLPRGPVQSITGVKIIAADGSQTTLNPAIYFLNAGKETLLFNAAPFGHIIEIAYVAGFGDASAVPDQIKQGMLAHIVAMYEDRGGATALPPAARALYNAYRVVAL